MRIVELHSENVMGIEAIDITPDRHVNTIGGDNGQGNSSLLNSMVMALGGKGSMPKEPLRRGTDKGGVRMVIEREEGNLIVELTIGPNGKSAVKVTSADGAAYPKPQALLNSMLGAIGFDPFAFTKLDEKKQAEQLRALTGIDLSDLDEQRQRQYERRTEINRDLKQLESRHASLTEHDDAPDEEIIVADLMAQLESAQETNKAHDDAEREAREAEQEIASVAATIESIQEEIELLKEQLMAAEASLMNAKSDKAKAIEHATQLGKAAEAMPTIDTAPINEQIKQADSVNAKVRANKHRKELATEIAAHKQTSDSLTLQIEGIDKAKQERLAAAPWPVEGLGFHDGGVTYNGISFGQCSSAEQLRVSLAMGMAANPKLKVLIIRDGSLIGPKAMEVIREQVEGQDFQVFIEVVRDKPEGCTVFISEGRAATLAAAV